MKLDQLQQFKHWHVCHAARAPVELVACDVVLAGWLIGWMILPMVLLTDEFELLPVSLLMALLPDVYRALRSRLHRSGSLRCDWLDAIERH